MLEHSVSACHGIAIEPAGIGSQLGWLDEAPAARAVVQLADVVERVPDAELVWQMDEPSAHGIPPVTSQTWREPGGHTWFGNTLNLAMRIDYRRGLVTVATKNGSQQVLLEALASIALPMLAQEQSKLVLHASAACHDGTALMLSAPGGSGKSSLMVGLVSAGWKALSEDQCVIDLDDRGQHRIWPGPSWVRFKHGTDPVWPATELRFEAADKTAWTLNGCMARTPARLERIVFLEPPGGEEPVWEPVSSDDTIARLAAQATWLHSRDSFARSVLPLIVNLALRVPAFRLRLPRREDWLPQGIARLTSA